MYRHDYVIVDAEGFVVMRIESAMTNKSFDDYVATVKTLKEVDRSLGEKSMRRLEKKEANQFTKVASLRRLH